MPNKSAAKNGILDRDQANEILRQNVALLYEKVKKGGTLTKREVDLIKGIASGDDGLGPEFVSNISKLAEALKVSRVIAAQLVKTARAEGWPKITDGRYTVTDWRNYLYRKHPRLASRDGVNPPTEQSPDVGRIQSAPAISSKERIAVEKLEVELATARVELNKSLDRYITKVQAREDILRCNEVVRTELERRLTIIAPAQCAAAGDQNEIREILSRHLNEAFEHIHSGNW